MPPRIGLHVSFPWLRERIELLKKLDAGVELYLSGDTLDRVTDGDFHRTAELLADSPQVTIHAPFADLSPGAVDCMVREATLARFRQTIRAAGIIKPEIIVFHSGFEKWKYNLKEEIWLQASLPTWRAVLEETAYIGCRIAIENIFEDTPDNLVSLTAALPDPRFGLCFDTGHFNLFSRVSLTEWHKAVGGKIIHMHIHDNDRSSDQHAPPGNGSFPFDSLWELMDERGKTLTLEAHSEEDAVIGIERLRGMLVPFFPKIPSPSPECIPATDR